MLADVSLSSSISSLATSAPLEGRNRPLADSTIATILKPLRACLGRAQAEGFIAHNPTQGLRLPKRETVDDDEDDVRALTADQLALFLELVRRVTG